MFIKFELCCDRFAEVCPRCLDGLKAGCNVAATLHDFGGLSCLSSIPDISTLF